MDWYWTQEEATGGGDEPTGRYGHSCVTIDCDHILMIGGKTGTKGQLQAYLLSRLSSAGKLTWRQLNISADPDFPNVATQRWAMASCFVKEKQFVFLHGGFDSEYNYGDTWLLKMRNKRRSGGLCAPSSSSNSIGCVPAFSSQLNNLQWSRERNTPPRAYHTAVAQGAVVYVFGGQCCVGGPYEYYNALLAFDFSDGPLKITPVSTTGDGPSPRSQCSSVICNNCVYILFGYTETQTLDDVYKLDLDTKQWQKVVVCGKSPKCFRISGIEPQPFRVHSSCRPCVQFDHRLIVLHPADRELTRTKSGGWSESREVLTLSEINLKLQTWRVLTVARNSPHVNIVSRGNPTLNMLRDKLVILGGHSQHSSGHPITFTQLLTTEVPRKLSWDRERLLWLGHLKNSEETCNLARIPAEMVTLIIQFVNGAALI